MSELTFFEMFELVNSNKNINEVDDNVLLNLIKQQQQTPSVPGGMPKVPEKFKLNIGQTPQSSVAAKPKAFTKGRKATGDNRPLEDAYLKDYYKKAKQLAAMVKNGRMSFADAVIELRNSEMVGSSTSTYTSSGKSQADQRAHSAISKALGDKQYSVYDKGYAKDKKEAPIEKASNPSEAIDTFSKTKTGGELAQKFGVNPEHAKGLLRALDAVYREGNGANKYKNWNWIGLVSKLDQYTGYGAQDIVSMLKFLASVPWSKLASASPFGKSKTDPQKWAIYPDVQSIDSEERSLAGERGGQADPNIVGLTNSGEEGKAGGTLVGRSKITGTQGGVGKSKEFGTPQVDLDSAMSRVRSIMNDIRGGTGSAIKASLAIEKAKEFAKMVGGEEGRRAELELDQIGNPRDWVKKMRRA